MTPAGLDGRHVPVAIVGGGQAGLAASWCLAERGVEHVVLERHTAFHAWREHRWDSFSLVTPNWQCRLPGHPYAGDDPDGFMVKHELLAYLEAYRERLAPPLFEGTEVRSVEPGYRLGTSRGTLTADAVVLAVGGYHAPRVPSLAGRLPERIAQVHSHTYRSSRALPDGAVLVVGTGQSGAQIAEDLHLDGRRVHLAVGSAPRVSRRYRGRDVVAWLHDIGHYDLPITEHPEGDAARKEANHYVTGRDGGRDLDLRAFALEGMALHGRVLDVVDGRLTFAADLAANLDGADAVNDRIKDTIDRWISAQGIDAPAEERYVPVWRPPDDGSAPLDLDEIAAVVWATGFVSDWSFVKVPAFDGTGYPQHHRGVTTVPGLYVLGLPWLHTWGSGRFAGIARDAAYVAGHIAAVPATLPAAA